MQKPSIPEGTRDFGPEQVRRRTFIFDTIRSVFVKFGFQPLETPAMENLSTLTGKYGDEGDKLLFKILNNGDYLKDANDEAYALRDSGRLLKSISKRGLRYDLTVPFARYVVMNRGTLTFPFQTLSDTTGVARRPPSKRPLPGIFPMRCGCDRL